MASKTVVVAFGGNAISRESEEGNIYEQFANTRRSIAGIERLIEKGYNLAITHGNGPQVGHMLIRVEESRHLVPPVPLGVIVADLEGGMGYMIGQSLQNKLMQMHIERSVVTILTQVIVNKDDPSIKNPTKFVGPFYEKRDAMKFAKERGWVVKKDSIRGYRRVVPSPEPERIVEKNIIKMLVKAGTIVIAAGGGGIPVYVEDDGRLEGVDGVIDKDKASAILARDIEAEELIILTSVDNVALNFGKKDQKNLSKITAGEAQKYLSEGHFPPGSMGPKIEAALKFLDSGGKKVIITSIERAREALEGHAGTLISN